MTMIIVRKKVKLMIYKMLFSMVFIVTISTAPMSVSAAPIRVAATDATPGSAALELYTDELVTMTAIPFRITIRDAAGRLLTGAKVSCDMTMPSMTMPENRPRVTERDGAYGGELVFTCAMGGWRISCLAENADGSRQAMTFDIAKVRMK